MTNTTKIRLSKSLIFVAVVTSISMLIYDEVLTDIYTNLQPFGPKSGLADLVGIFLTVIFISGLYLGSRGLGVPLSFRLLITLLFSSPSKYILIPYLVISALIVIYYELFWITT